MIKNRFFLAGLAFWSFLVTPLSARIWTADQGWTFEAEFVSATDKDIKVVLENGETLDIPLVRLTPMDRKWVEEALKKEEKEGLLNWDDTWPDIIEFEGDPNIEVEKEDTEANKFVYSSENYRFICDVRLSKSVVGTFADMFEATRLFCQAVPLAMDGGKKVDGKYVIILFETKESYFKAGGPVGSVGVFFGGSNVVMVPLSSLGVRKVGSGYMRDRDKNDNTLIHELTHQLTPGFYYRPGLRGWFTEGIAEYVASTPYSYGRFRVGGNIDEIVDYATAHGDGGKGGRALGKEIKGPPLEQFMMMPYSEFAGARANFNYGFGLLMTTYFFHLDGDGDAARLKAALKIVRGQRSRADGPQKILAALLDGRTFAELEEDISEEWRRKGVKISFPSGESK